MYGLASTTFGLTIVLTGLALMVTAVHLGSDLVWLLALLGGAAAAVLPVHIAVALPAALFGGALLAGSGERSREMRTQPGDIMAFTIVVALFSLYLVGWAMPAAYHASAEATSRYVKQERSGPASPAARELPDLLRDGSTEAQRELWQRLRLTIACIVFGALAAALVASPLSWSAQTALGATAVAFIWQTRELMARLAEA